MRNWRRLWCYVERAWKAIMTSWNRLRFFNFEKAWEVSNRTRYRKSKIHKISSYYYKTYRYRNASTLSPTISNKRASSKTRLTILHAFTSTSQEKAKSSKSSSCQKFNLILIHISLALIIVRATV